VLGGETIGFPSGLAGHSDADVLLHAVCDALLGAAGLGDIGAHFPDTDPTWSGIASHRLLERVVAMVGKAGWRVGNIDAVIEAERPRLAPYIARIERRLTGWLGVDDAAISVKAKTGEGVGPVGRGEAIAARCVCLLERSEPPRS
jgi:2-C-methyl-D-erythritol 2,4-cyclodiphosphate synthase